MEEKLRFVMQYDSGEYTMSELLPEDDRWFTIYFAQYPIARFDSQQLRVTPLLKTKGVYKTVAGEGDASPSPATPPLTEGEQQVSGMCPV
jgi:hypothetical protein